MAHRSNDTFPYKCDGCEIPTKFSSATLRDDHIRSAHTVASKFGQLAWSDFTGGPTADHGPRKDGQHKSGESHKTTSARH